MKRNIMRTVLAVLTALVMATAFSACGGGSSSTHGSAGNTPSAPVTGGGASLSGSAQ